MQHGTQQETVLDILESAIAVLRREREVHGRPLNDVLINLETAHVIVSKLRDERPPGPVGSIRTIREGRYIDGVWTPWEASDPFQTLREDPFDPQSLTRQHSDDYGFDR